MNGPLMAQHFFSLFRHRQPTLVCRSVSAYLLVMHILIFSIYCEMSVGTDETKCFKCSTYITEQTSYELYESTFKWLTFSLKIVMTLSSSFDVIIVTLTHN